MLKTVKFKILKNRDLHKILYDKLTLEKSLISLKFNSHWKFAWIDLIPKLEEPTLNNHYHEVKKFYCIARKHQSFQGKL